MQTYNKFLCDNKTINNDITLKGLMDKKEKPEKQNLKEKLLRNF